MKFDSDLKAYTQLVMKKRWCVYVHCWEDIGGVPIYEVIYTHKSRTLARINAHLTERILGRRCFVQENVLLLQRKSS